MAKKMAKDCCTEATVGKSVIKLGIVVAVMVTLAAFTGCGTLQPYQASSGLATSTPHRELLTSISLIEISPPTQERSLSVPVSDFHTMILGSWNEATVLKVVASGGSSPELTPDAILTTHFVSYEDRIGSSIGALEPARVGFIQKLVKIPTGQIIWEARFSHTDRSATDNLLDTKGSGWHTPIEVAKAGFSIAAQNAAASIDQYFKGQH